MADYERTVLTHYNLASPYPTEWPAEKNESDASDEDLPSPLKAQLNVPLRRSKSKFSALERSSTGRRSLVPGSQKTREGLENLVQKDESDPLGGYDSVVRVLRDRGLPVESEQRLRNRFLLSSTTFSPTLFLSQVHSGTSTQQLLQGLEHLSRSIDQKSASLKILVESNFERFVRAKSTIDNVYTEMQNQGAEPEPERPLTHSRHASRNSTHYRNLSNSGTHYRSASGQGPLSPGKGINKPLPSDKKKNALVKESEYGVQGIKAPLIEVAVKAEEVWGPALGGREREEMLKAALSSVERCQEILVCGQAVSECIKRNDHENLVEEYSRATRYTYEARDMSDTASRKQVPLSESQLHQIVITGRTWLGVEEEINDFKRGVWRKLTGGQQNIGSFSDRNQRDEHIVLISILLELGVEDNPIWFWLLSRYDSLKNKIHATFDRSRVEIEVLRRRLANAEKTSQTTIALHLKSLSRQGQEDRLKHIDTAPIMELWELIYNSLNNILSVPGGLLGEVTDFWDRVKAFIEGKVQKTLPVGIDGQSRQHHRLSNEMVRDLQNGVNELIDLLRENVFSFFADPPIEDISMLYSPLLPTTPNTPKSAVFAPWAHQDSRFKFDASHPPPPSPKKGEPWEEFAFWPPYANSLSGVHYLGKILSLLGTAATEMANMRPISSASLLEKMRSLVGVARERTARAVCSAWNADAESCKFLEDWAHAPDRRDITKMPSHFIAFESAVLVGMQKILYIPDAAITKSGSADVVLPPPSKLLQVVRSQFVTSLYKALSGMVENAEKKTPTGGDVWATRTNAPTALHDGRGDTIDASSRNIRMLLTLSNLKALQATVVPQLIGQFETNFSVKLTDESKTIRDVLAQIDTRLFESYTSPTAAKLSSIISAGIASPGWAPNTSRPTEVRPYVYEALLLLVFVHTEVSTTAAPLTHQILSHLLEKTSVALLEAFKLRTRYSLPALMQATLDVEFVAQTLNQYTTDRASNTQSHIYLELDRGTDNDARTGLQDELPEMRAILKNLREATRSEFSCFKKVRVQKERVERG